MYGPPRGVLLLAEIEGMPGGLRRRAAARRPPSASSNGSTCAPRYRGTGLGRRLAEAALQAARDLGYPRIRLDTLPQMAAAQRLYESLGFRDIPAYYGEPDARPTFHGSGLKLAWDLLRADQSSPNRCIRPKIRVLGALLEKEITTPEYYPLTLNALVNACNQKSSRDPVVNYDEDVVQQALALLRHKGLAVRISGAGHRVEKYGHSLGEKLNLGRRESARAVRADAARSADRGRTARAHRAHVRIRGTRGRRALPGIAGRARRRSRWSRRMPRGRWCHLLGGVPDLAHERAGSADRCRARSVRFRSSASPRWSAKSPN